MTRQIILASASPRRKELFQSLGVSFSVVNSGVEETTEATDDPAKLAADLAAEKAETVAGRVSSELVLGADTVVVVDHEVLGKPVDDADARRMLRLLRDRWHEVITGVAIVDVSAASSDVRTVETRVRMAPYSDREIDQYVASGEPRDKAGSYAIQGLGSRLVETIEGCYTNVVGLPVCEVARLFSRFGVTVRASGPVCRNASGEPCPRLGSAAQSANESYK